MLLAALYMMLFCAIPSYSQPNSPSEIARSEADGITQFAKSFHDYDVEFQALKKNPRAAAAEIASVEKKANSVRSGISAYRRNLTGFIAKLKGAGEWTSKFDSLFEERAAKSGFTALIADVKAAGGARAALEKAVVQISDLSAGIEQDLKEIKGHGSKAAWFNVNLVREAQAVTATTTCGIYKTTTIVCTYICTRAPCCRITTQLPTCPPCCL